MPLIPVRVGDLTALIDTGGKPKCCVPGCNGEHWTSCDYPVGSNLAKAHTCDAKLCKEHVVKWGEFEICPAHSRFVARPK
jgi:hypothetical protein